MMAEVKTRAWGNSLGIVIPRNIVEELGIVPGQEVLVEVNKKGTVLKDLFGSVPLKRKTSNILKDVRTELEGKFI